MFFTADCEPGARIDKFLSEKLESQSRSGLDKLLLSGNVRVNGRPVHKKSHRLAPGDTVAIENRTQPRSKPEFNLQPENIKLDIVFEDEHLLVVNKPKGMPVHPSQTVTEGTLANALLYHCGGILPSLGESFRPGIVHRIDRDTSGLLVAAKTDSAYLGLSEQVLAHTMRRTYTGIVHGGLKSDEGTVTEPIARHPVHRTKYCVNASGRKAVTNYRVLARYVGFTHASFTLVTGRTHQIRVHMAHLGHPLAGDPLYGPPDRAGLAKKLKGQCLHAGELGFVHPVTCKEMSFTAEAPRVFLNLLSALAMEGYF